MTKEQIKSKIELLLSEYKIKFNRNEVLGGIKFDYYVPSKLICIDVGIKDDKKYEYCVNNGMAIIQLDPICKTTNVESILIHNCVKKRKPRSGRNPSKFYWQENLIADAILRYKNSNDQDERNEIYETELHKSFAKLIENIFNTFKFSYFDRGPEDAQSECLTHLVANIHKFDPTRISEKTGQASKSFSYFSIIAKHYLILLNNKNYERFGSQVSLDVSWGDGGSESGYTHNVPEQLIKDSETYKYDYTQLNEIMVNYLEKNINKIFTKQRDLNIANAVVELFRNSERIDTYNKKALYLYIREMAMCKTQQISKVVNRLGPHLEQIKKHYDETGCGVEEIHDISFHLGMERGKQLDKKRIHSAPLRKKTIHSKFSKECKHCKQKTYYKTREGLNTSIKNGSRCRVCGYK